MIYVFDCDEVLREFDEEVLRVYNKKYNDAKTIDDLVSWKMEDNLSKMTDFKHFVWNNPRMLMMAKPVKGSLEYLKLVKHAGHTIGIATYQFSGLEEHTLYWLNENKVQYDFVFFGKDKHLLKADVFVDDKISNLLKMQKYNPNCSLYLKDRPWNQELNDSSITRIKELSEVKK